MLLSFSAGNYKSFRKPFTFSLQRSPEQTGLDYCLLQEGTAAGAVCGLCSSVIYGLNAAGKTQILSAVNALRTVVLHGYIRNGDAASDSSDVRAIAPCLELIPNSRAGGLVGRRLFTGRALAEESLGRAAVPMTNIGVIVKFLTVKSNG